jgi:hypothetical protein
LPTPLRAVHEHLFDDEGLSAPDRRPMADALAAHARRIDGPYGRSVGPFVCPASRLEELAACVAAGLPRPAAVGVVGYGGPMSWRRIYAAPGLVQVESPLGFAMPPPPGRVAHYVEIAPYHQLAPALDQVAQVGAGVKVRGTGLVGDVPTPAAADWLAAVLAGCAARDLTLKVAAGPAHAYWPGDGGGGRPGIVNLLAAAGRALERAGAAAVGAALTTDESGAAELHGRLGRARELLASIGARALDVALDALASRGLL